MRFGWVGLISGTCSSASKELKTSAYLETVIELAVGDASFIFSMSFKQCRPLFCFHNSPETLLSFCSGPEAKVFASSMCLSRIFSNLAEHFSLHSSKILQIQLAHFDA